MDQQSVSEERKVYFDCPQCGQDYDAPPGLWGKNILCTTCREKILVPFPEVQSTSNTKHDTPPPTSGGSPYQGSDTQSNKACPFCGETILAVAQKCKHCGEFLNAQAAAPPPGPLQVPASVQVVRTAKSRGVYIILALFLGGLFGVHNFYAGRMAPAAIQLAIALLLGWFVIGFVINFIWVIIELFVVTEDGSGVPFA